MRMRIVLPLLVWGACGKNTEPPPPSSGSPMAQTESGPSKTQPTQPAQPGQPAAGGINAEAQALFAGTCATCHGPDGKGQTQTAQMLKPPPRNYTDKAWQASVTDDELRKIILEGGAGVGKSPSMPGNPGLKDKPEVVTGLVQIIRNFGKQ